MANLRESQNGECWDKSDFVKRSLIYLLSFIVLLFLPLYYIGRKVITYFASTSVIFGTKIYEWDGRAE